MKKPSPKNYTNDVMRICKLMREISPSKLDAIALLEITKQMFIESCIPPTGCHFHLHPNPHEDRP